VNLIPYVAAVGLFALGWLVVYRRLRNRLDREIADRDPAEEVREELQSIMVEINRATEQNVAILEDKIEQLSGLLKDADRKIGLLRRESEKNEVSRQVYSRVFRAPSAAPSEGTQPRVHVPAGSKESDAQASSETPGEEEAATESLEARILRLSREGFSPEMIAGRVGSTASEVQLIISLAGRRR
jgi:hypothetical protein